MAIVDLTVRRTVPNIDQTADYGRSRGTALHVGAWLHRLWKTRFMSRSRSSPKSRKVDEMKTRTTREVGAEGEVTGGRRPSDPGCGRGSLPRA
jgi:hypothetical protein